MKNLKLETILKITFITFIALLGVICLVDGILTNNTWLLSS